MKRRFTAEHPDQVWCGHDRPVRQAWVTAVAAHYLLGVSTRRMERLIATLGITGLSKS